MKIKFFLVSILLLGLYLIVSFSRDLWYLRAKQNDIGRSRMGLEQLETKNAELKARLEYVKSDLFVEKEARDKLGMAKEGETVYILPENMGQVQGVDEPKSEDLKTPIWQRWWRLFF